MILDTADNLLSLIRISDIRPPWLELYEFPPFLHPRIRACDDFFSIVFNVGVYGVHGYAGTDGMDCQGIYRFPPTSSTSAVGSDILVLRECGKFHAHRAKMFRRVARKK